MGYRPDLGFMPETIDNLIERLRVIAQEKLGYSANSAQEFIGSNIWLVYYAVALMKNQTDLVFEELIDKIFDHFLDIYGSLEQKEGSCSNGLNQILKHHTKGYELENFHNNPNLNIGELRVCFLEPDIPALIPKLSDYYDFTVETAVGEPLPTHTLVCDIGFPVNFYYTPAKATPLYLCISYTLVKGYVPSGKEKDLILEEFLKKWNEFQVVGRDFLPNAYLGNSPELPFIAEIQVGYKLQRDEEYKFTLLKHQFAQYFTIVQDEDETPLIEIVEKGL